MLLGEGEVSERVGNISNSDDVSRNSLPEGQWNIKLIPQTAELDSVQMFFVLKYKSLLILMLNIHILCHKLFCVCMLGNAPNISYLFSRAMGGIYT